MSKSLVFQFVYFRIRFRFQLYQVLPYYNSIIHLVYFMFGNQNVFGHSIANDRFIIQNRQHQAQMHP